MSDFEDDPVVRDQLQRLAGHYPDEDVAYAAMVQRVRVAKRRRAVIGAGGLCAVLVVGLGASALVNRDTEHLSPAATSIDDQPVPTASPSTTETTTPASTSTSVESSTSTSEPESTEVTNPDTTVDSSQPSVPESRNPSTSNQANNGQPTNTSTGTYVTKGGTITVIAQNGVLSMTSHTVIPGFEMKIEKTDPDRIRVRFDADGNHARIEVRLVDGTLISDVSDNAETPDNTFDRPDNDGGRGGDDNRGEDDHGRDHGGDGRGGSDDGEGGGNDGSGGSGHG